MLDLRALAGAVTERGRVARVVVAATDGSTPREVGAEMLVWADGQSGTIGGGTLEHRAVMAARAQLETGGAALARLPLGPALGQCCGGAVTLLTEVFDIQSLPAGPIFARSHDGSPMPLAVKRALAAHRGQGQAAHLLAQGWFVEPVAQPRRALWIWGAGHVGRALVSVMAPLPDLAITWVDIAADRFPADCHGASCLWADDPADLVAQAPQGAEHLILTFSHTLDLELCHRLLTHGFARAGLIGSATKWARFRTRLGQLGHERTKIERIDCPIGDPTLGKHPQAIAIGVAQAFLRQATSVAPKQEKAG